MWNIISYVDQHIASKYAILLHLSAYDLHCKVWFHMPTYGFILCHTVSYIEIWFIVRSSIIYVKIWFIFSNTIPYADIQFVLKNVQYRSIFRHMVYISQYGLCFTIRQHMGSSSNLALKWHWHVTVCFSSQKYRYI